MTPKPIPVIVWYSNRIGYAFDINTDPEFNVRRFGYSTTIDGGKTWGEFVTIFRSVVAFNVLLESDGKLFIQFEARIAIK